MTQTPGVGESNKVHQNVAELFWSAMEGKDEDRTPESVVRHALGSIRAFEEGKVQSPRTGNPMTLMELLAVLGMGEDLVYASPELARGETFDERSLVFTIGVLIFERLTDRHPFGSSDNPDRLARIRRCEMHSGVNYFPSVPKELRAILIRAMGPFPEERYTSLHPMKKDLARFVGEPHLVAEEEPSISKRPKFFDVPTVVAPPPDLAEVITEENEPPPDTTAIHFSVTDENKIPDEAGARPVSREQPARPSGPRPAVLQRHAPPPPPPPPEDGPVTMPLPSQTPATSSLADRPGSSGARPSRRDLFADAPELSAPHALPAAALRGAQEAPPAVLPIGPGARLGSRTAAGRYTPLIYSLIGAVVASMIFVLFQVLSKPRASSPASTAAAGAPGPAARVVQTPDARPPSKTASAPRPDAAALVAEAPRKAPDAGPRSKEPQAKETGEEGGDRPAPAGEGTKPPATAPASPAKPGKAGEPPEIAAGTAVGEAIRSCNPGDGGKKSFRVAVFMQPTGKVARAFADPKQGISTVQSDCIRRTLRGVQLDLTPPEGGFIEWRLRVFSDRVESRVVGPPALKKKLNP